MIRRAFPDLRRLLGGKKLPFCFSFSPFIVVFCFLNRVPRVGICPISISLQLLGVVVSAERYGFVRHQALNALVATSPLDFFILSVVFSCFSAFPVLWNDMECRHWSHVASFTPYNSPSKSCCPSPRTDRRDLVKSSLSWFSKP